MGKNNVCMQFEYMGKHHWGLIIYGKLYRDYETFDEAADAYEELGGTYPSI